MGCVDHTVGVAGQILYSKGRGIELVNTKSFVDDLILGQGDVSIRAGSTLRGTESQPYLTRRFVGQPACIFLVLKLPTYIIPRASNTSSAGRRRSQFFLWLCNVLQNMFC